MIVNRNGRMRTKTVHDHGRPGWRGKGGNGSYRLHLPGIRVLYEIDEEGSTVHVINVARVPGSG